MMKPLENRERKRFLLAKSTEEGLETPTQDIRLLTRLFPYMRKYSLLFTIALTLMPVMAALSAVQPAIIKFAVDAMVAAELDTLTKFALLFLGAVVAEFIIGFIQTYTMQLGGQKATAALRSDVFDHIEGLSMSYFDRTPIGRVVTRVTNDIDSLAELFSTGAITAAADLLKLAFYAIAMMLIDLRLALFTFLALPPLLILVNFFRKRARKAFRAIRFAIAQLNTYMAEQVSGLAVVKAYGKERESAEEYSGINDDYRRANFSAIKYDAFLYSVVEAIAAVAIAGVLYFAAGEALGLEANALAATYIGTVVAFYEFIQRFFIPIRDLATKYTVIQQGLASAERIFATLDIDELDGVGGEAALPAEYEGPAIRIEDLTFAYRPGQPVLDGINFDIERGQRIAIVGSTGSGKTTLTSLLLRLYEPPEGSVFLHGRDVRELDVDSLRSAFSVVPQDVFLFSGTILDNIALGAEPDHERAQRAIERVSAGSLIASRGGLNGEVSERGQNFSAGERQLLAFARAVYHDRPFLILDEATANVDSETEAELERAVHQATEGRTSIIIAHRLSTIRDADRILVFHRGRLAESGTHDELIARDGIYRRLHALHFESDQKIA